MASKIDFEFLNGSAVEVAPRLLGCVLERRFVDGTVARAKIVETEAYDQTDVASHSYNGRTPRTEVMFGPSGHLYVYFTYGMHYCGNIVVGEKGFGAAVLIRALEPLEGIDILEQHRKKSGIELTNGPAKLCQALMIDRHLNGHDLKRDPLKLLVVPGLSHQDIVQTTRIGISQGREMPWRFFIKDNEWVSKPAAM